MRNFILVLFFGMLPILGLAMTGYSDEEASGKVIIFHAGSLSVPFAIMEKNFEETHPGINVEREASGSRKCARKIVDLKKDCDIMASADYRIIDNFLIPKYADWNVRFATNQMVLAYTDRSEFAGEINKDNWFTILAKKGVVWGHSDPNLDPCGYRSLMVLQLTEIFYQQPGLYQKLIRNRPVENIRPKSVELISLLQTGNMDYAWEYRSVAVQHGLKYLELPPQINLGDPDLDNFYRQAEVKISGKKPGEYIKLRGQSITYGITLLKQAPDRATAELFLKYLLSPDGGLKVLEDNGQTPLLPPVVPSEKMRNLIPSDIRVLVK